MAREENEFNRPTDDDSPPHDLVPGFVATREELFELVKHWEKVRIWYPWVYFTYGQSGGWHSEHAAICRISSIRKFLGEKFFEKAIQEAHVEFQEGLDPEDWRIFMEGSEEERQAIVERNRSEMERLGKGSE